METLDLNINHYELSDILKLFNISHNFNATDLKHCKKQVLMTHPDKSNLSKDYFLFFSKAYKILYTIYEFKNKNTNCPTSYRDILNTDDDKSKQTIINEYTKNKNFHKYFNEAFENTRLENDFDKGGYSNWLKTENIIQLDKTSSRNDAILKHKLSIIRQETVKELNTNTNTNIIGSKPEFYSAPIFSKLSYDDVMKAYSETLIPVDERNINRKYNTFEELKCARNNQKLDIPTMQQSYSILEKKNNSEQELATIHAYKLVKQQQEASKKLEEFNKQFHILQ
tara:strand:- start:4094 stop:4939 length:846 start_codon:yes stop_codon:yes gene_type:complete